MPSPITCRTLCDRLYRCYYFKERECYRKSASSLFKKILKLYAQGSDSLISVFTKEFCKRKYTGNRLVYKHDREEFKKYCINCAGNLDSFLHEYALENISSEYCYKQKIRGYIDGQIKEKGLNVSFSYKNAIDTHKDLDFFGLNNYIYNQVHEIDNNCIVMSVPTNSFYLVKYNLSDYTIKRGFFSAIQSSRSKVRGLHCYECENACKSEFINGLERLKGRL